MKKDSFALDTLKNSYFYDTNGREFLVYEQGVQPVKAANEVYASTFLLGHFSPVAPSFGNSLYDIYIQFTVDTEGLAKDFRLVNCEDRKAYKKMLDLVKTLPRLLPAYKNGVPIETSVLVPIYKSDLIIVKKPRGGITIDNADKSMEGVPTHQATLYNEAQRMKDIGQ